MPYFICRLATEEGQSLYQSFLAPSAADCRRYFESEGFCVLSVKKDWKRLHLPNFPFEKKIKDKDFIMFNQELIALLRAGYPILKSLELISGRTKNLHLKELLLGVEGEIRSGKALSESFSPFEKHFTKVYTASLMAGEQSGNLPGTIGRYLDYARVIAQTKTRIRTALVYPTLLLTFSLILMGILVNFILPQFARFYLDFEAELPAVSQFLIKLTTILRKMTPFLLGFGIAVIFTLSQLRKREKNRILLDKLKLRIPYARRIWTDTGISLFSRTLGLLLEAGITLLPSLPIASQAIPNKFLGQQTAHLPDDVRGGETLSDSLGKAGFFPMLAIDMIRIGETSANLHGLLREVADVYDEKVKAKIDTFVSLIEPIIIIFMGMLVALMLLSVYLPIFNIIQVTK